MKNTRAIFKALSFVLISVLVLTLSACGNGNANDDLNNNGDKNKGEENYPYTLTDSRGENITILEEPKKVVSMGPNITEIVYALDKGSSLVGRTDYCNYPEEVSNVEAIGDIITPNVEKILSLEPDLVLISGTTMPNSLNVLEEIGTKFVVIDQQSDFEGVYETIQTIGKILNASDKAEEIVSDMKKDVDEVQSKVKDLPKPKTYYIMGYGEAEYTATGDTFLGKMLEMAGADNIAKDATGWKFNIEDIISANPEVLILSSMGGTITDPNEVLAEVNGYKELTVVKEKKVKLLKGEFDDMVSRQGPRLAKGLKELAKLIHPEVFN